MCPVCREWFDSCARVLPAACAQGALSPAAQDLARMVSTDGLRPCAAAAVPSCHHSPASHACLPRQECRERHSYSACCCGLHHALCCTQGCNE